MTRPVRHSVKAKLEALKRGVELPVDPRFLHTPGDYLDTDEKAVHVLAREYQKAEDADYSMVTWANQEKAAAYFNAHGLIETLDEISRVGGPEALS